MKKKIKKLSFEELLENHHKLFINAVDNKFDQILTEVDKKLYMMRSDNAKMQDQIVGELKTMREEMAMLNAQHQRIIDHEGRLENLEKIHPQGIHVAI